MPITIGEAFMRFGRVFNNFILKEILLPAAPKFIEIAIRWFTGYLSTVVFWDKEFVASSITIPLVAYARNENEKILARFYIVMTGFGLLFFSILVQNELNQAVCHRVYIMTSIGLMMTLSVSLGHSIREYVVQGKK